MAQELPLEKIAKSFESNIQAIRVLNDTIGCIADDHDNKIKEEFKEKTMVALTAFLGDFKEEHKEQEHEEEEEKELSEKETEQMSEMLNDILFSSGDFRKAHKNYKKSAPKQGPILRRGALISLLGCFETLVARLIREFYKKYPEAFPSESKSLTLADLKEIGTIEDAELHLVDTEIDSILRGNISSQINYFKKPLRVDTTPIETFLDKVVEVSQRRNIIVHNDGIVNKHYLSKAPSHLVPEKTKEGCTIEVSQEYIDDAIKTFYTVGLILLQQCFRKWEKNHIDSADSLLIESAFEALVDKQYDTVLFISDFVNNVTLANDSNKIILLVNHAIALRDTGNEEEMNLLLDNYDWSSVSLRFKLALHTLKKDDDNFYTTLEKTISAKEIECSELLEWPLFHPFQQVEKFKEIIIKHWPDHDQCESDTKVVESCNLDNKTS